MTTLPLEPAGAMFLCGQGGCDSVRYLRCPICRWTCVDPVTYIDEHGQLPITFVEETHTEFDCRRIQREHPQKTFVARTAKQQRAHNAYERIHSKHAPARMTRKHGVLTCPTCGFQP